MRNIDPRLPGNPQADASYLRLLNIRLNEVIQGIYIRLDGVENMYPDLSAEVAITGKLRGKPATKYNIMGRRASWVNTTSLHDMCEFLSTQNIPDVTGLESWEVVSSSASDTSAGTGARTVHITYLDSTGKMAEITGITLNGTTPVSVPGLSGATFIQWMEVATVGSGTVSAGNIDLRTVSGSVVHERITAGGNRSLSGRFKVPSGCRGFLLKWDAAANSNEIDFRVRAQSDMFDSALSSTYLFQDLALVTQDTARDNMNLEWQPVPSGAIVKVSAIPSSVAVGTRGDTGFHIICREE